MCIESKLSDAGFTIIGALIGAVATYIASKKTWQNLHFNEAATLFADAFVPEVISLRKAEKDTYLILSEPALERHERAIIRFQHHLSESRRALLQEEWEAYTMSLRTTAPGSITNRVIECSNVLSKIDSILSFAKHR